MLVEYITVNSVTKIYKSYRLCMAISYVIHMENYKKSGRIYYPYLLIISIMHFLMNI